MRIAELAELAGVTVRTIRYYHQVGALPEPPRRSNGYRDYNADHLVTLLRIAQLTGSGLSLAHAGALAAESSGSSDEVLDEIDRALETRIAALTEQRTRLAQARAGGHLGLSRVAAALSFSASDLPVAVLFAHLYRDQPTVEAFADALLEPESRAALASIQRRFEAVDETTPDGELEGLAAEMRSIVSELGGGALAAELPPLAPERSQLLLALAERELNDRQKEFLRRRL
ncbi:MerR family transcriptional regulator [Leucobacter weissii]|uniref:MerR family transcriptional regulator n=1 Tax=Leucobacter weissii TaxID=1983706 RepID=A0A939MJ08_9MICO|nr:MerR family transcriptional regulator [Leucobacter weissii]MBO1900900.1 MerR family transcriptional regulator [Leucobacter weissii]